MTYSKRPAELIRVDFPPGPAFNIHRLTATGDLNRSTAWAVELCAFVSLIFLFEINLLLLEPAKKDPPAPHLKWIANC
jgi:hypothetical protein